MRNNKKCDYLDYCSLAEKNISESGKYTCEKCPKNLINMYHKDMNHWENKEIKVESFSLLQIITLPFFGVACLFLLVLVGVFYVIAFAIVPIWYPIVYIYENFIREVPPWEEAQRRHYQSHGGSSSWRSLSRDYYSAKKEINKGQGLDIDLQK